jgi:DNA-binding transcriptional LysR family regulator
MLMNSRWAHSGVGSTGAREESVMTALIDVDQLRTFIAIVETGSFTRAADVVHKTQSAVSMQMKRLEERLDRPIFARDGRASKLTEDGERLLDYARRIVKLNVEALAAFNDAELTGRVRLGLPDDYADRYLPEIMARFSRAYPGVELTVLCEPSVELFERIDGNELDLAIVTNCESNRPSETFRRERLLWVTSNRHSTHTEEPLPLALGRSACGWRRAALECLDTVGRPHRLLYSSVNAGAVAAAVLAGLAVSVLPESGLRPGMRVLNPAEGFPELPSCSVGLVRNAHEASALADALAEHIISSLDNLSEATQAAE